MVIDCDSCSAGPRACADCVVSYLTIGIGEPLRSAPAALAAAAPVELDAAEERALHALAAGGLVPPIRMQRVVG